MNKMLIAVVAVFSLGTSLVASTGMALRQRYRHRAYSAPSGAHQAAFQDVAWQRRRAGMARLKQYYQQQAAQQEQWDPLIAQMQQAQEADRARREQRRQALYAWQHQQAAQKQVKLNKMLDEQRNWQYMADNALAFGLSEAEQVNIVTNLSRLQYEIQQMTN